MPSEESEQMTDTRALLRELRLSSLISIISARIRSQKYLAQLLPLMFELLENHDDLWNLLAAEGESGLIEQFYKAYETVRSPDPDSADSTRVCKALFDFYFCEKNRREDQLSFEEIHGLLSYRESQYLWRHFVRMGADETMLVPYLVDPVKREEVNIAFVARSAELERRSGNSQTAERLFRQLVERIGDASVRRVSGDHDSSPELTLERAIIEYQLAYSIFNQGRLSEASEWMKRSAESAWSCGDQVGGWIAKCLEYRILFFCGNCDATTFLRILDLAEPKFRAGTLEGKKKAAAKRWITNVLAHRIEAHLQTGDAKAAKRDYDEMAVQDGGGEMTLLFPELNELPRGMVAFIARQYLLAEEAFSNFISGRDKYLEQNGISQWEAVSMPALLSALSKRARGDLSGARDLLVKALTYPAEPGNHTWLARAARELEVLDLSTNEATRD